MTVKYRYWSTIYTEYDEAKGTTVQEKVIIKGEPGKQIKISNIGMRLKTAKYGYKASARVLAVDSETTTKLADFEEPANEYKDHSQAVNYLAPGGSDVSLLFHLKTNATGIRAYMEVLEYSYELIDYVPPVVGEPEQISRSLIVVSCASSEDAESIIEKVKSAAEGKDVQVYEIKVDMKAVSQDA